MLLCHRKDRPVRAWPKLQFYPCERHMKASQWVSNDKFTGASYFDFLQSVRPTPQNEAITVHFKPVTLKASESKYTKVASISFDGKYRSSLLRTCQVLLKTYLSFIDYFHSLNKMLFIILRRKWNFPTQKRLTVLLNFSYF